MSVADQDQEPVANDNDEPDTIEVMQIDGLGIFDSVAIGLTQALAYLTKNRSSPSTSASTPPTPWERLLLAGELHDGGRVLETVSRIGEFHADCWLWEYADEDKVNNRMPIGYVQFMTHKGVAASMDSAFQTKRVQNIGERWPPAYSTSIPYPVTRATALMLEGADRDTFMLLTRSLNKAVTALHLSNPLAFTRYFTDNTSPQRNTLKDGNRLTCVNFFHQIMETMGESVSRPNSMWRLPIPRELYERRCEQLLDLFRWIVESEEKEEDPDIISVSFISACRGVNLATAEQTGRYVDLVVRYNDSSCKKYAASHRKYGPSANTRSKAEEAKAQRQADLHREENRMFDDTLAMFHAIEVCVARDKDGDCQRLQVVYRHLASRAAQMRFCTVLKRGIDEGIHDTEQTYDVFSKRVFSAAQALLQRLTGGAQSEPINQQWDVSKI